MFAAVAVAASHPWQDTLEEQGSWSGLTQTVYSYPSLTTVGSYVLSGEYLQLSDHLRCD